MKIYDYNGKKNICGERIREARLKQRLSQSDLAARVQVEGVIMERDSISRVEIGTRFVPDYEIPIFAKVLGVSVLWVFGHRVTPTRFFPVGVNFFTFFQKAIDIHVRV